MYPVPGQGGNPGAHRRIRRRVAQDGKRATNSSLPPKLPDLSRGFGWIRNGPCTWTAPTSCPPSIPVCKRLQTDYVDLYQIHWPASQRADVRQTDYDPALEHPATSVEEQLTVLSGLVQSGKVRHIGLSNETPWGVAEFLKVAERLGLQRIVSIQNPYSLINRTFEAGLHEMCHREQIRDGGDRLAGLA